MRPCDSPERGKIRLTMVQLVDKDVGHLNTGHRNGIDPWWAGLCEGNNVFVIRIIRR